MSMVGLQVIDKCKFFAGSLSAARIAQIADFLGFSAGMLPFTYLGVPIFQGKPQTSYLKPIVDRIKTKLVSWKGAMLSIMGRVQLVKSIIHGMLAYSFHVYAWLKSLLKSLDAWIRNFIWSGDIYSGKLVTVSWKKMGCPVEEGGVGLRCLRVLNEAAILKLSWEVMSYSQQWAALLKARFVRHNKPVVCYAKSSIWLSVRCHLNSVLEGSYWCIGNGKMINFWKDCWLSKPIVELLEFPNNVLSTLRASVSDFICNNSWKIPTEHSAKFPDIAAEIKQVLIPPDSVGYNDLLVWKSANVGFLTFKEAFNYLRSVSQTIY